MGVVGFRAKRVFHREAFSHSEFLPYTYPVLSVVNGARTFFSKVAENCIGVDVLAERAVVCISMEQRDNYLVRNTQ